MNFKDYSAHIAKKANVNEPAAQRLLQALFADVKGKLDNDEIAALPTLGRLISQNRPDGGKRVILARPGQKVKSQMAAKKRPIAKKKK